MNAIIFDYGGTLDTRGDHWARVLWDAWQQCDIPVTEQQFRQAYVFAERTLGRNPIILPSYTFKKLLDVKLRLELEYVFTQQWWKADKKKYTEVQLALLNNIYQQVVETVAHSREVLLELRQRCPLALVSNFYGNISAVLGEFRLDGIFQSITESAVVGIRKPDPRIFQKGIDDLGLQPQEVLVVGDSIEKDIIPAKTLGCPTAWMKGRGWTDEAQDATIPTYVISDLSEIKNYV